MKLTSGKTPSESETTQQVPPWESSSRKFMFSKALSDRLLPFIRIQRKFQSIVFSIRFQCAQHYHLHLVLKNRQKHWIASGIFRRQDIEATQQIEHLHGTLTRKLTPLRNHLIGSNFSANFDLRSFRGQFVQTARCFRGLSREQLCRLLNSHPNLSTLGRRHPTLWSNFPFTPKFIEKFETETCSIFEEITQGLLFGVGFPTEVFAKWVSEILNADEEFEKFNEAYKQIKIQRQN